MNPTKLIAVAAFVLAAWPTRVLSQDATATKGAPTSRESKRISFDSPLPLAVQVPRGDGTFDVHYTPTRDGHGISIDPSTRWIVRPAPREEQSWGFCHPYDGFRA